jgi:prevent-host-death family protein
MGNDVSPVDLVQPLDFLLPSSPGLCGSPVDSVSEAIFSQIPGLVPESRLAPLNPRRKLQKTDAAELAARLSNFLEVAQAGREVIITQGEKPVARLVPPDSQRSLPRINALSGK